MYVHFFNSNVELYLSQHFECFSHIPLTNLLYCYTFQSLCLYAVLLCFFFYGTCYYSLVPLWLFFLCFILWISYFSFLLFQYFFSNSISSSILYILHSCYFFSFCFLCHDLAKQLSHYLFLFSFYFLLDLLYKEEVWESIT